MASFFFTLLRDLPVFSTSLAGALTSCQLANGVFVVLPASLSPCRLQWEACLVSQSCESFLQFPPTAILPKKVVGSIMDLQVLQLPKTYM